MCGVHCGHAKWTKYKFRVKLQIDIIYILNWSWKPVNSLTYLGFEFAIDCQKLGLSVEKPTHLNEKSATL